jgi:hypothetical protein
MARTAWCFLITILANYIAIQIAHKHQYPVTRIMSICKTIIISYFNPREVCVNIFNLFYNLSTLMVFPFKIIE